MSFKQIKILDLHPVCGVAQSLDNQWIPDHILDDMLLKEESASANAFELQQVGFDEFIRSLLTCEQIVVNRAFFLNNVVLGDILRNEEKFNLLRELLNRGAVVPFLFTEESPLAPVRFKTNPEQERAWRTMCDTADLQVLRLSWDDTLNRQRIMQRLARAFTDFCLTLSNRDAEVFVDDLGLDRNPENINLFRHRLLEIGEFSNRALREAKAGPFVTREIVEERFCFADGHPAFDCKLDAKKPFAKQLKQIFDLKYNLNLSDALQRYSVTPAQTISRSVLQEDRLARSGQEVPDLGQICSILGTLGLEAVTRSLPDRRGLDLSDVAWIRYREPSNIWSNHIALSKRYLPDPGKNPEEQDFFRDPKEAVRQLTNSQYELLRTIYAHRFARESLQELRDTLNFVVTLVGTPLKVAINYELGRRANIQIDMPRDIMAYVREGAVPFLVELVSGFGRDGLTMKVDTAVRRPLAMGHISQRRLEEQVQSLREAIEKLKLTGDADVQQKDLHTEQQAGLEHVEDWQ